MPTTKQKGTKAIHKVYTSLPRIFWLQRLPKSCLGGGHRGRAERASATSRDTLRRLALGIREKPFFQKDRADHG